MFRLCSGCGAHWMSPLDLLDDALSVFARVGVPVPEMVTFETIDLCPHCLSPLVALVE